jgi:antitoxin (DNA-binding transcriptional repressor) of toxin-antitoxin stability system
MRRHVNVTEALRNFSDYLNRVAYRGERFVLVRGGKPVAELSPIPDGLRLAELSVLLASLPRLTADEAAAFASDVDAARAELNGIDVRDAWES